MSKKIFWFLIFGLVYASTGASFVNNGFSARSEAMGEAFTAVADDLDAFYYNPAGFAWQKGARVNSYVTKINNLQNDFYAGLGSEWQDFYLAINFQNSSLLDIPITVYDGNRVVETGNSFDYRSSAMNFSMALGLGNYLADWKKVAVGFNFKLLSEKLYDHSASGYGMDLGLLYLFNDDLKLGCSVVNLLEPKMTWTGGHRDVVARNFRFGGSYLFDQVFLLSVDLVIDEDQRRSDLGLEYLLNDYLCFRAGMSKVYYSFGFGTLINNFNFDYSFSQPYDDLQESTHKFALGYYWSKTQTNNDDVSEESFDHSNDSSNDFDNNSTIDDSKQPVVENNFVEESIVAKQEIKTQDDDSSVNQIDKVDKSIFPEINVQSFKLIKKSILLTDNKVKGFYKIENTGNYLMDIKITVKVLNDQKLIGEKSLEYKLPAGQQNVYSVIVDIDKSVATEYKVKSFIQIDKTKTESYLDYLK